MKDPSWAFLGRWKLNTDASVSSTRCSGGGLLRDHEGRLVFAFYKEFGDCDVLMAEALALLHGLQQCVARGYLHLDIEVDSQSLVSLLSSQGLIKWPLCYTVSNICCLLRQCQSSIRHIYREANAAADALASLHLHSDSFFQCTQDLPLIVRGILTLDRMICYVVKMDWPKDMEFPAGKEVF